eukprot:3884300-Pyramimonas_sp.AAC.2
MVAAAHLVHRVECFGGPACETVAMPACDSVADRYVLAEATTRGHIDAEKCTALGLPPGRQYKDLKAGKSVTLPDGTVITPEEVIGPEIIGRKLVVLGDTCDPSGIAALARGADVL